MSAQAKKEEISESAPDDYLTLRGAAHKNKVHTFSGRLKYQRDCRIRRLI